VAEAGDIAKGKVEGRLEVEVDTWETLDIRLLEAQEDTQETQG
jgi:hypothetical protein